MGRYVENGHALGARDHLLVSTMPPLSKLRLSILLLFLQLFVYLYVVPRGHHEERAGGYPLEEHCKLSLTSLKGCPSGSLYFKELAGNCGIIKEKPIPEPEPIVEEEPPAETDLETPVIPEEEAPVVVLEEEAVVQPTVAVLKEETNNSKMVEDSIEQPTDTVVKTESVHEKSGHLIYQIIVVLLFLSVSFALADCFQERAKKKGNPKIHLLLSRERRNQRVCEDCSRDTVFYGLIEQLSQMQILVRDFSAEVSKLMYKHSKPKLINVQNVERDTVKEISFRPTVDREKAQLQLPTRTISCPERFRSFESDTSETESPSSPTEQSYENERNAKKRRQLFATEVQRRISEEAIKRRLLSLSSISKFSGQRMSSIPEFHNEAELDESENKGRENSQRGSNNCQSVVKSVSNPQFNHKNKETP